MEKLTSKFLARAKKFLGTTTLSHPSLPGMTSEEGRYSTPLPLDQVWEEMLGTLDTTRWRPKHTVACSGQWWLQAAQLSERNSRVQSLQSPPPPPRPNPSRSTGLVEFAAFLRLPLQTKVLKAWEGGAGLEMSESPKRSCGDRASTGNLCLIRKKWRPASPGAESGRIYLSSSRSGSPTPPSCPDTIWPI